MQIGAPFLLAFVAALAFVPLSRVIARRFGLVAKPREDRWHTKEVAMLGGVGIALSMLVAMLVLGKFSEIGVLSGAAGLMFLIGLADDIWSLKPVTKLVVEIGVAAMFLYFGYHLNWVNGVTVDWMLTLIWIVGLTNAFNLLDNMDGLSAGVAAVCTAAFLTTAVLIQQWFVAASLALLLGALLGFLCFNFNPASIFMGDSGSLVIGLVLGVLTIRTTYLPREKDWGAGWYAVFAPVIVLAVPLYDLVVVSTIRILRGKSPFVGDTNHFSHRLVARGMSKRTAVLCIYLVTASTAVAAVILPHVQSRFAAVLIFVQTLLILGVVGLLEQHPLRAEGGDGSTGRVGPPPDGEATRAEGMSEREPVAARDSSLRSG